MGLDEGKGLEARKSPRCSSSDELFYVRPASVSSFKTTDRLDLSPLRCGERERERERLSEKKKYMWESKTRLLIAILGIFFGLPLAVVTSTDHSSPISSPSYR